MNPRMEDPRPVLLAGGGILIAMNTLRPYQPIAIAAAWECWASGERDAIWAAATGTGKTTMSAQLALEMWNRERLRTMFCVHRRELVEQASQEFFDWTGIRPSIEMGDVYADRSGMYDKSPFVMSTFQTQSINNLARANKFNPNEFGLIIHDEGHRGAAKTHEAVMRHYMQNPVCRSLKISATLDRADKKQLRGKLCFEYPLAYPPKHQDQKVGEGAIRDGYLIPLVARQYEIEGLDFSSIHTIGGDLSEEDLAKVIGEENILHAIACAAIEASFDLPKYTMRSMDPNNGQEELARAIVGKKPEATIIFLPARKSVWDPESHRERTRPTEFTMDILNRWLPDSARQVHGDLDPELRNNIISGFKAQRFPFLCDCDTAVEGFNAPATRIVVMGRPHKHRGKYTQKVGRITRPDSKTGKLISTLATAKERREAIAASCKPNGIIVDLVGETGNHRLCTPAHLFCSPGAGDVAAQLHEEGDVDAETTAAKSEEIYEQITKANLAAQQKQADDEDHLMERAVNRAEKDLRAEASMETRRNVRGVADLNYREVNPLDENEPLPEQDYNTAGRPSPAKTDNERQLALNLIKMGVQSEQAARMASNPRQGYAVLQGMRKKRCSDPQAKRLRSLGYSQQEISRMNFRAAMGAIDMARKGQGSLV